MGLDVTDIVRELTRTTGELHLNPMCEEGWENDLFGDPAPGVGKSLWLRLRWTRGCFPWSPASFVVAKVGEEETSISALLAWAESGNGEGDDS